MALAEQRKHQRVPLIAELTIEEINNGHFHSGRSIDISRGGVGFFSTKFLATGSDIRITFHVFHRGQSHHIQVYARVVRTSPETRGTVIGAAFDTELTPAFQPVLCGIIDDKLSG